MDSKRTEMVEQLLMLLVGSKKFPSLGKGLNKDPVLSFSNVII